MPQDEQEDGAGLWDDLIERTKKALASEGLDADRPLYYLLSDALNAWLMEYEL